MNWSFKKINEYCVVDLPKNVFEKEKIESLKDLITDLSDNDCSVIYLNMGQISKVCSKSLGLLINIYKFACFSNIEIKLYNLQPYVSQLIYQTRMNQIFDICAPDSEFNANPPQELYSPQVYQSSCQ